MQLEVGKIVEGKVTGITKFGAFVELEPGQVGMVHISEVAPTYVNDISEHLKDGQQVTVKVLAIGEDGKISLSIKKAMAPPPRREGQGFQRPQNGGGFQRSQNGGGFQKNREFSNNNRNSAPRPQSGNRNFSRPAPKSGNNTFEDMLSKFIQSSDEKISDIKKSREVNRRGGGQRKGR